MVPEQRPVTASAGGKLNLRRIAQTAIPSISLVGAMISRTGCIEKRLILSGKRRIALGIVGANRQQGLHEPPLIYRFGHSAPDTVHDWFRMYGCVRMCVFKIAIKREVAPPQSSFAN